VHVNVPLAVAEEYVFLICAAAEYPDMFNTSPEESVTSTVIEKSAPWSINMFASIAIYTIYTFLTLIELSSWN
jgi:hypothetical protein